MSVDALQPWDKRQSENPRAFQMFVMYRDMGPTRSLRKLAEDPATLMAFRQIAIYSSQHNWVDRAAAWDAENDRIRQIEHREGVKRTAQDHVNMGRMAWTKALTRIRSLTEDDIKKWTPREIMALGEFGMRLERLGRSISANVEQLDRFVSEDRVSGVELLSVLGANPELLDMFEEFDRHLEEQAQLATTDEP
jgi:hypothetical protein